MIKHTLTAGLISLSSLAMFGLAAPVHAQTALVGNVFVDSNPGLIRPSGFEMLSLLGYGGGTLGYGGYSSCGLGVTGIASPLYSSCGTTLYSTAGIYASPCGSSVCNIPVLPFGDCPLLFR